MPAAVNFFNFPSFELDSNSDGLCDGLSADGSGAVGTETRTRYTDPYDGTYCQRWQWTDTGSVGGYRSLFTTGSTLAGTFSAGQTAYAAIMAKGSYVGCMPAMFMRAYNSSNTLLGQASGVNLTVASAYYDEFVCSYAALPTDTDHVLVFFRVSPLDTGDSFDLRFDCLLLKEGAGGHFFCGADQRGGVWDGAANESSSTQHACLIDALAPSSGGAGTPVVIQGDDFGAGGSVTFDGVAATVQSWTYTTIHCVAPAGSPGAADVIVTPNDFGGGSVSAAFTFTYSAAGISSLSPTHGPCGSLVNIIGTNMGTSGTVTVGGVTAHPTSWTPTLIVCPIPPVDAGARDIVVTPTGASADTESFTVDPLPIRVVKSGQAKPYPFVSVKKTTWKDPTSIKVRNNGAWWLLGFDTVEVPVPPPTGPTVEATSYGFVGNGTTDNASRWAPLWASVPRSTKVHFATGDYYSSARQTPPDSVQVTGDGAGKTILSNPWTFGSNQRWGGDTEAEGLTMGRSAGQSNSNQSFIFKNGAHDSFFGHSRFRADNRNLWDANDAGAIGWTSTVVCNKTNFHDMLWSYCEMESVGSLGSATNQIFLFVCFPDSRSGGGAVYNLRWDYCDWGVKNARGYFGQGWTGWILQPGPTEHKPDGPRPGSPAVTNMNFDWMKVTHGTGMSACCTSGGTRTSDSSSPYGRRTAPSSNGFGMLLDRNNFVGPPMWEGVSLNPCDYTKAWAMTVLGTPGSPTAAQCLLVPDKCVGYKIDVTNSWISGSIRREETRAFSESGTVKVQGTTNYHVRAETLAHDAALY